MVVHPRILSEKRGSFLGCHYHSFGLQQHWLSKAYREGKGQSYTVQEDLTNRDWPVPWCCYASLFSAQSLAYLSNIIKKQVNGPRQDPMTAMISITNV